MVAPNASLTEIYDEMATIEWATLNDAALGAGKGIGKAYPGMPGKINDTKLPCTVRWAPEGDYAFNSGPYDVPIGSEGPASLLDEEHLVVIGLVIAKRDNKLVDISREAARWINLLPELAYVPNNTLNHKVLEVKIKHYSVVEMPIGSTAYMLVTWPARISVRREVISRQ